LHDKNHYFHVVPCHEGEKKKQEIKEVKKRRRNREKQWEEIASYYYRETVCGITQFSFAMENSFGSLPHALIPPTLPPSSSSHHSSLVIYLKDKTFIPDFIDLKLPAGGLTGVDLQLCNSDGIAYHITCHGFKDYQNMKIDSNKSIMISFGSSGKFELTCPEYALMKVSDCDEPSVHTFFTNAPFPSPPFNCSVSC
jgi:hypothetical protein